MQSGAILSHGALHSASQVESHKSDRTDSEVQSKVGAHHYKEQPEGSLSQKEEEDLSQDPFSAFANFMKIPQEQRPAFAGLGFLMVGGTSFAAVFLYQQRRNMLKDRGAPKGVGKGAKGPGKGLGKGLGGKALGKGKPGTDQGKSGAKEGPATYARSDDSNSEFGGTASSGKPMSQKGSPPDIKSQFAVAEFSLPPRGVPPGLGGGTAVSRALPQVFSRGLPAGSLTPSRASSIAMDSSGEASTAATFHGAAGTSGGKTKSTRNHVQDVVKMLRSVELIQVAWRRWKSVRRMPELGQHITLSCEVIEGADMPNVNRFGGCDPFVECRVVRGDPSVRRRGDVDRAPLRAARTEVKRNDANPRWDEKLSLAGIPYDRDLYVQLVLWDYNLMRNTPIAHAVLSLEQALKGSGCHSSGKQRGRLHTLGFSPFSEGDQYVLSTKVSVRFGFWEAHRHRLTVCSGLWLPKVKMLGTISSYVEARVVGSDPRKASFQTQPSNECLWSGRTSVVGDKVDPTWNQEFAFTIDADPSLWLHLILWDTNAPLPDMPVGQIVEPMPQVSKLGRSHAKLVEQHLQLEEVPGWNVAADLSRAKLVIKVGSTLMSADDSEEED